MGKKTQKKVVAKKLIGFDSKMLEQLNKKLEKGFGRDETDVLRKLLSGEQQFRPSIEAYISSQIESTGFSRVEVIEFLLLEALRLRDGRFLLGGEFPKPQ